MVDYYAILQVSPNASAEVIKSAYKALGKKYHPDNNKYPPKTCEEKMIEINMAYDVLSNPEKKKVYDMEYQKYMIKNHETEFSQRNEENKDFANNDSVSNEEEKTEGLWQSLWRGFECMTQKNRQIIENAYYDGLGMDNYELVLQFTKNYGFKRQGYAKVLEERGMLERNHDGKLVPTSKFRLYWR